MEVAMAGTSDSVGGRPRVAGGIANGARSLSGAVAFSELVRIHDSWEQTVERDGLSEDSDDAYHRKLKSFERAEGKNPGRPTARCFAGRTPEQLGRMRVSDPNTEPNVRPNRAA
jgi:hypothetical protein